MCKKSRRIMEFKYFYFEKYTEYYDFPTKTEDGSYRQKSISLSLETKLIFRNTKNIPKVNYCSKLHDVHLKLALPIKHKS